MTEDQLRQLLNVLEAGVLMFEAEDRDRLSSHELKACIALMEARAHVVLQLERQSQAQTRLLAAHQS